MRVLVLGLLTLACGCLDLEVARFARVRASSSLDRKAPRAVPLGIGRSCVTVVGIVPVTAPPSLGDAIAAAAADMTLVDAVVRYELRYVPLLGGQGCYVVEGRPE